ncbi:hypothetical protein K458DRAFT_438894 [Lentithecium fluviatile CBS 122367]|uniref:Uncharacterized protein n=1 Tax=Lentithecium fluviatile CBS 122367 TaxID=1168545 RepID=A0A6G1JL16_9PLEO|nr:hypothetical protein K458DRAFT_438894 [Lentithecium fluviatile CBS 122367]
MILPDGDNKLRSLSPTLHFERPPSPPTFYAHSNRSARTLKLGSAPEGRREPSLKITSSPLSSHSSRSTLRNMGDSEAHPAPRVPAAYDDALASSPTVDDSLLRPHTNEWQAARQRRLSNASSSTINSDDLEDMRKQWPGFDSHAGFDDSGVDLEDDEEEGKDQFPVGVTGETENEPWLHERSDSDDNAYSSDLYSRRAEMILANAKKRLNVMEGNLRGARQSLVVSPTMNSSKMSSELSQQISAARERDRRLYAGIGPIPPRSRAYHSSPLSPNSPIHARGLSETSVPLPFSSPSYLHRSLSNKRASSAMGQASGPWSPEGYGHGRFPIRESRSFEVMRERNGWDDRDHSARSHSRGSKSPPHTLETLPEDGSPKLHRSASTTSSLRDQMDDLKGRISSLKQRAKEDHMRRRSLQSLRAPSPFTSAETWYSGTEAYKNGTSPVAADAGVGIVTQSPTRKALFEEDEEGGSTPKTKTSGDSSPVEPYGAVKSVDYNNDSFQYDNYPAPAPNHHIDDIQEPENDEEEDDEDFVSVEDDNGEAGGSSIYEDAVYEMPATERHEDRVDAFDYEHFFLHSAMGTYSQERRGSSSSDDSGDSSATTRPVTAIQNQDDTPNKRVSYHQRNYSADSVSTVASFATAAEEQWDDEEANERMDQFSQQILPTTNSIAPRPAQESPRSDSAINMRKVNGSPSTSQTSRGSSPAGDLMNGLQTSKIFSIMLETPRDEPRLALSEEEKQLIYSLASSFQQVCTNLQNTAGDQYERKEWRRRLDEARRILNGEDFEGQPF